MSNILDDSGASSSSPARSGFGIRLGAYLIDGVFMIIILSIVTYVFAAFFIKNVEDTVAPGAVVSNEEAAVVVGGIFAAFFEMIKNIIWGIAIGSLLYTLIEGITGASPGKMILGLKIGNANGGQAATGALLIRWGLKNILYISWLLFAITNVDVLLLVGNLGSLFLIISCLMALRASKRALHDDIAGTAVFKKTDTFA